MMYMTEGLKKGDLIVIAYANHLGLGIYWDSGPKGNPRYLELAKEYAAGYDYKQLRWVKAYEKHGKIYKTYINRQHDPIAKIDEVVLKDSTRQIYHDAMNYLKEKGEIV